MNRPPIVTAVILGLAACTGGTGGSPVATQTAEPTPSPSESPEATASPSPTASAIARPTDAPSDRFAWTEAARYGQGGGTTLVTDISAWSGGFVAIGHAWEGGSVTGPGRPLVWTSPDGRTWSDGEVDLGESDVELRGILRLSTGGIVLVGEVGVQAAQTSQGTITTAAWRSDDGVTWNDFPLPTELTEQSVALGSGPIGHVASTGTELWYSAEAESWQQVESAGDGGGFGQPAAGEEGFVVTVTDPTGTQPRVLASGDGLNWVEGEPPTQLATVAPWRGDWLAWGYTEDPPTISVFRSANGLDWQPTLDVNDLTPPDGPKAGLGMESGITEASLAGEGGVGVLSLGWNHCCAVPSRGVGVWTSTDGETWGASDLPETAYVTGAATDGEVMVLAGHLERGAEVAFWVADR